MERAREPLAAVSDSASPDALGDASGDAARADDPQATSAWLIPVAGPPLHAIELKPADVLITIGRQENCQIRLPADAVSRRHAQVRFDRGRWRLSDLKSRWGTSVNGVPVQPGGEVAIHFDDLIRISPWTFNFSPTRSHPRAIESIDDGQRMSTLVRSIAGWGAASADAGAARPSRLGSPMAEERLSILLDSAAAMHAATDERSLADVVVDAACRGSGLPNAALLRPIDAAAGRVEIITARHGVGVRPAYSRTLLAAASGGDVAEFAPHLGGGDAYDVSNSLVAMNVDAALCVPLVLGTTVAAHLYLDARGGNGGLGSGARGAAARASQREWEAKSSFCLALGRIASLALANLKRVEMERRAAAVDAELRAAAEAQRWVLPQAHVRVGGLHCAGQSRPGHHVGGDFFDIVPLPDGCVALALGDVSGKGIAASVLMTAAAGFLHAAVSEPGARVESAVRRLSQFVCPRRAHDRFVTLWVGIIDPTRRLLHYVDAGHGYALLCTRDHLPQTLDGGDNLPIGVDENHAYAPETIALPPDGQLLIVSDGVIEQPAPEPDATSGEAVRFGVESVRTLTPTMLDAPAPLDVLFAAVVAHACSNALSDDATALIARWSSHD